METLVIILTVAGIMGGAGVVVGVLGYAFYRFTKEP